jgi:peptidoglycan/LPS O-acetylase OafA/YrhL
VILGHLGGYLFGIAGEGQRWEHPGGDPLACFLHAISVGVDLFFVVSGFLLVLPFAGHYLHGEKPVSLRAYFTRRLTRLEPPYLVHLLVLVVVCAVLGKHVPSLARYVGETPIQNGFGWFAEALRHIAASSVYCHYILFRTYPVPNGVLWSLEVEVQFYILVPLLAGVFAVRNRALRRTIIGTAMVASSALASIGGPDMHYTLLGHLQEFLAGFLLVDFYLTEWRDTDTTHYRWDAISLIGWVGILFRESFGPFTVFLLPWLMLLAYLSAFRGILFRKALSNPWITTIGGMCYTIYMYHNMIISGLIGFTMRWATGILWLDFLLQTAIFSVILLGSCSVMFLLFERPFMQRDWHKKLWARLSSLGASATVEPIDAQSGS